MRETMWRQPDDLRRVLGDAGPAERAAERIAGRRVLLSGTGTSWHAANHGAALLRLAGVEAWAVQAGRVGAARARGRRRRRAGAAQPPRHEALHERGARARARAPGRPTVQISAIGAPGADIETCEPETQRRVHVQPPVRDRCASARSRARSAPISGRSTTCPTPSPPSSTTRRSTSRRPRACCSSSGSGTDAWVAAEGALKIRETAYVAAAGYSMEYLLHGPSVAIGAERRARRARRRRAGSGAPRASSPTSAPATARASTASAATRSARRSRSSRSRPSCSASRSRRRSASAPTPTRSARICPAAASCGRACRSRRSTPRSVHCAHRYVAPPRGRRASPARVPTVAAARGQSRGAPAAISACDHGVRVPHLAPLFSSSTSPHGRTG